jgi:hypothetical protein
MDQNNDDRGIDLSHALDDSSSRIKFEGEEFQRPRSFQDANAKIVEWVIKYSGGYVKDEKQANYFLIGFVVVAIVGVIIFGNYIQYYPRIGHFKSVDKSE